MLKSPDSGSEKAPLHPPTSPGQTVGPGGGAQTGSDGGAAAAGRISGDALQLLNQVVLTFTASGLRYWGRTAELWAKTLPSMVQALSETRGRPEASREAWRTLLDELRAYVRDLAELPALEARRLQAELDRIAAGFASGAPPGEERNPDAPWRRWEMKP